MNKKIWIPFGLCTFALGFGVAWSVKPDTAASGSEASTAGPRKHSRPMAGTAGRNGEYRAVLSDMREHRLNSVKLNSALDQLDLEELPDLLAALAARAGVSGLDMEDKSVFEKILKHWYKKNPDAALAWVLALESEQDQRSMLRNFLELETANDLDGAIALLEMIGSLFDKAPRIPMGLIKKAAARDVDTLLRVCVAGMGKGNGTGGMGLEYVENFDFAAALNGLAAAEAAATEGQKFSTLPSNMLQEWAKREPQAALNWLQLDKEVTFNSGIEPFLSGYKLVASDEEMGSFVAHLYEVDGGYDQAWNALSQLEDEGVVRHFLTDAAEHGSKEQHLEGLFRASLTGSGSSDDGMRTELLSMMDSQSRYQLLASDKGTLVRSSYMREALRPALKQMGHSPEEIEQMLPEPTKNAAGGN